MAIPFLTPESQQVLSDALGGDVDANGNGIADTGDGILAKTAAGGGAARLGLQVHLVPVSGGRERQHHRLVELRCLLSIWAGRFL